MADNPFDRTNPTMRDCWDAGFAAGVAAERDRCAKELDALALEQREACNIHTAQGLRMGAAAIRAGEVRG